MRLLWLPDKLRAYGLTVVEDPGWQKRGAAFAAVPEVAIGHHTGTPARAKGDLPTLRILRDGRSDLPGPLCQVGLSRSGVAHVIASGKANHAGRGAWGGVSDSSLTVGCEVEHPGSGPWTAAQLGAFDRVMAALLDGLDQPASRYCGHREWAQPAGRKPDPAGVDLDAQRRRIHGLLGAPSSSLRTPDAPTFTRGVRVELARLDGDLVAFAPGLGKRRIETQAELDYWHASGRIDKTKVVDLATDPRLAAVVDLLPWLEARR